MKHRATRGRLVFFAMVAVTLGWSALLLVPHVAGRAGPSDALEYRLLDLRYRLIGPRPVPPDVVIVAIDDQTLSMPSIKEKSRRERLALLLTRLAESGARGVALDVLLADRGGVEEDEALAVALSEIPTVIAAAARFGAGASGGDDLIWPQERFRAVAKAGLVNLSTDAGGTPRYVPLLVNVDGQLVPSLPLLAALLVRGEKASFGETALTLGDRSVPLDVGFNMPLRYLGPEGTVATYSASSLLDRPRPDILSGKLVVLGYSATAMGDRFATPFDDSTPGMELIATAISQLTSGPALRRDSATRQWDGLHSACLALICVGAMLIWPLSRAIPAAIGLITLSMIAATAFLASGIWISAALPLVAALPPVALAGVLRYGQERRQASRSERTAASLKRFQSPALARRIERDPDYLAVPQEQELVVFFVDLTGFTGMSQRLGTEGTRQLLRLFHGLTDKAVEDAGGSVFNFMGDGALAVFGLEQGEESRAEHAALDAAFSLVRALSEQRLDGAPGEALSCRIGLHRGVATLSRLGADSHLQLTVTGDTVNLASRLMEVAKTLNAAVVASDAFCAPFKDIPDEQSAQRSDVDIRGRAGSVPVLFWSEKAITARK